MDDRELAEKLNTIIMGQLRLRQLLDDNLDEETEEALDKMYGEVPEIEEDEEKEEEGIPTKEEQNRIIEGLKQDAEKKIRRNVRPREED